MNSERIGLSPLVSRPSPSLKLVGGPTAARPIEPHRLRYSVNGFPATLRIWSRGEWESTAEVDRPEGVRDYPGGLRVLFVVD